MFKKYAKKLMLVATMLVLSLCGCSWWQGEAKPVVQGIDDVAKNLCSLFYSGRNGITVEEAVTTYCKAREQYAPWIDPILRAQREGNGVMLGVSDTVEPTVEPIQVPCEQPQNADSSLPHLPPENAGPEG